MSSAKIVDRDRGFWQGKTPGHLTSKGLQQSLVQFCKNEDIKSVVDFGCGDASYIKKINNCCESLEKVAAFDGNPNVEYISGGFANCQDLTIPFNIDYKFDLVLSLEVAEHISKKYELTYVDNIINHVKNHLIISWALVGQTGTGHVNCQNNDYVIDLFTNLGFSYQEEMSLEFRNSIGKSCKWFKDTIMYFKKVK